MSRKRKAAPESADGLTLGERVQGEILRLADGHRVRRLWRSDDVTFVGYFDSFDESHEDHQMRSLPSTTRVVEIIEARQPNGARADARGVDDTDPLRRSARML